MLEDKGSLKLQHMQSVKNGIHESFSEAKPSHQLYHHHLFCFLARCKAHTHSTLSSLSSIIKHLSFPCIFVLHLTWSPNRFNELNFEHLWTHLNISDILSFITKRPCSKSAKYLWFPWEAFASFYHCFQQIPITSKVVSWPISNTYTGLVVSERVLGGKEGHPVHSLILPLSLS